MQLSNVVINSHTAFFINCLRIEPLRLSNFVLSEGAGPDAPLELTIQRVKWGAPRSSAVVPTLQTDTVEMPHTHQMMDRELSINWVQLMLDLTVGKTRRLEDPNEPLHSLCTKNNLEPAFTAMLMCTSLSLGHPIAAGMDDIVRYPTIQHEQDSNDFRAVNADFVRWKSAIQRAQLLSGY